MIYKVQMPDGSVLYSDSVPSGGKVLEEREAKSTPRVNTVPSQPSVKAARCCNAGARQRRGSDAARYAARQRRAAPPDNIATLERELAVAKKKLELGREPLPGERRGLAGGGSRLTPEYEARIAGMERDVAAIEGEAEERLRQAIEKRPPKKAKLLAPHFLNFLTHSPIDSE